MADLATLQIKVDSAGAIRAVDSFGRSTENAAKSSGTMANANTRAAAATDRLKSAQESVLGPMRALNALVAVYASSQFLRSMIQQADAAKLLESRLVLVTKSQAELNRVQEALRDSASRTGTSYAANVELFARIARSSDELKKSQEELLRFTELVQMSIQNGGSSADEAQRGVTQLAQAMAGGTVRAEEFNAILEQTPGLALSLAQGLQVSQGELRRMVIEGRLSSAALFEAIERVEKKIRDDFAKSPQTVGKAFVGLKNDALFAIGEIDSQLGASSALATTIKGFSDLVYLIGRAFKEAEVAGVAMATGVAAEAIKAQAELQKLRAAHGTVATAAITALEARRTAIEQAAKLEYDTWLASKRQAEQREAWESAYAAAQLARIQRQGDAIARGLRPMPTATPTERVSGAVANPSDAIYRRLLKDQTAILTQELILRKGLSEDAARDEAARQMTLYENTSRQIQQTLASGIAGGLEDGLKSWESFVDTVRSMVIRLAADIASQKLFESISNSALGGKLGLPKVEKSASIGAGASGLLGAAAGAAVFGGVISSMLESAKAQREAARAMDAQRDAFVQGLRDEAAAVGRGDFEKQLLAIQAQQRTIMDTVARMLGEAGVKVTGTYSGDDQNRAKQFLDNIRLTLDALAATGGLAGKNVDALVDAINALSAANDLAAAKKRELKRAEDEARSGFQQDITLRELMASGLDDAAEAQRLWNSQVEETAKAIKLFEQGVLKPEDMDLERLAAVQARERENLARKQAEDAAARLKADLDRQASLGVELARLTGDPEAEAMARALDDRLEMDRLLAEGASEATRALLEQVQAAREIARAAEEAAAAQRKLEQQLRASQDLDVEILRAEGKDSEAEKLERELTRQRRLKEAVDQGFGDDYIDKLRKLFEAQDRSVRDAAAIDDLIRSTGGGSAALTQVNSLTGSDANRVIGELTAIRVNTRQSAEALTRFPLGVGAGGTVNQVRITVNAGASSDPESIAREVSAAVNRLLAEATRASQISRGLN